MVKMGYMKNVNTKEKKLDCEDDEILFTKRCILINYIHKF